jgi:dTDP-4-amino-4,6-dideoxygalactose transaminase
VSLPFLGVAPPLPPGAWLRRPMATMPFPLAGVGAVHAQARAGLYHGLRALGLGPGDTALLPAYHHGSEVEAYVRAGITPRFYDTGPTLLPDPAELAGMLTPDVRVVHVIHYLGLAAPIATWREFADRHDLLLVEDAAQGWLGSLDGLPLGSTGDLALFSLYKSVGVPNGGIAIVRGAPVVPAAPLRFDPRALARRHALFLAGRSSWLGELRRRRLASRAYDPDRDFDLGDPDRAADRSTLPLLRRSADPSVADRRRQHYRRLLDVLGPWVPEPFGRDPGTASPFAFPVMAKDKAQVIAGLRAAAAGAVDAWSVAHPSLDVQGFPGAARWRTGLVLLPVHQVLRGRDVDRLARTAHDILTTDPGSHRA